MSTSTSFTPFLPMSAPAALPTPNPPPVMTATLPFRSIASPFLIVWWARSCGADGLRRKPVWAGQGSPFDSDAGGAEVCRADAFDEGERLRLFGEIKCERHPRRADVRDTTKRLTVAFNVRRR